MAELKTKYMGIELKNPIIVGASNLVQDTQNLKKMEEAGAAAIVYKSLFEEQIQLESLHMEQDLGSFNDLDSERGSIFPEMEHAGPAEHLMNLKKAKQQVNIPIIASLNAVYEDTWLDYAVKMANTGVEALELNFYANAIDPSKSAKEVEQEQIKVLKEIKAAVSIPVSVKLSPYYSNTLNLVKQMDKVGVDGFVMFNRLFQPDIDIEKEEHQLPYNFSSSNDNRIALRYAGLLHGTIKGDICSNTGILTGEDAIKMLLAGADVVQIVSALYKKGISYVGKVLEEMQEWMERKGYNSVEDFRGKLSKEKLKNPFTYKRAQYVDILMHSDEIFPYNPVSSVHGEEE